MLSVHVPFRLQKRGGRKAIVSPDGTPLSAQPPVDNTLIKALARAHRWKRLLEEGHHANIGDLARAEKISPSFVSRVLRLTLLAPDIVEAIMDGRQGPEITMKRLLEPFPVEWEQQPAFFAAERH
jgi:hypothetical protein